MIWAMPLIAELGVHASGVLAGMRAVAPETTAPQSAAREADVLNLLVRMLHLDGFHQEHQLQGRRLDSPRVSDHGSVV